MHTPGADDELRKEVKEEVKKEFQLERMILFSDAVFAIVITLMAIEIRLPEGSREHPLQFDEMLHHLAPVLLSYAVSFFFIGMTWYQHLRIFALLKSYDLGLVVRNLVLLFCVGLFPFGATVIASGKGSPTAFCIYVGIILLCMGAQYFVHQYILVGKPSLRTHANIDHLLVDLHKRKVGLVTFVVAVALILAVHQQIEDPEMKPLAMLCILLVPISIRVFKKK